MSGELTLPEGARLLHVGPPKTGTTAIQAAFHEARGLLRQHGVHYAGSARRPKLAGREFLGKAGRTRGAHWQALLDDVRAAGDQRVCISNESFTNCDDAQAEELVRSLGGDAVHVAMVARPFDALLPSHWQQAVRNQWLMGASYDEWLQVVLGDDRDQWYFKNFWRLYDLEDQMRRWSAAASPERVIVVVAQEGDHTYLPRLFEQLLGLPGGVLEAPTGRTNSSLTLTGAELLRALDRESKSRDWAVDWYQNKMKVTLADAIRQLPRDPAERAIQLPPWAAATVSGLNERRADLLEGAAVRVIGNPGSMRPENRKVAAEGTSEEVMVPLGVAAGALASAVDELLRRERMHKRRVRRLRRRLERTSARRPRGRRGRDAGSERTPAAQRHRTPAARLRRRIRGRFGRSG
jgi:hypothetical protein